MLELPLARPTPLRGLLLDLPDPCLRLLTWGALAVEVSCLPLCSWRKTRPWAWLAATLLQLGILVTIGFAELTLGMLLAHAFVYDPAWGRALRARLARYSLNSTSTSKSSTCSASRPAIADSKRALPPGSRLSTPHSAS